MKWQHDSEKHQEFYEYMHNKVDKNEKTIAKYKLTLEKIQKQNGDLVIEK